MFFIFFLSFVALQLASCHMSLVSPPPLGHKLNPFVKNVDWDVISPLSTGGNQFPCKKFHLDPSRGANNVVATYAAGSTASFTLSGSAYHQGGSCQVSLSYDRGTTWKVIKSWIGDCPMVSSNPNGPYFVEIPAGTPSGNALFSWSWFNKIGNREMYNSCAEVAITGGGSGLGSQYPPMFVANTGTNGCGTVHNYAVEFPNPGPNVVRSGEETRPPIGSNCV